LFSEWFPYAIFNNCIYGEQNWLNICIHLLITVSMAQSKKCNFPKRDLWNECCRFFLLGA
jgi:hypothetical protein